MELVRGEFLVYFVDNVGGQGGADFIKLINQCKVLVLESQVLPFLSRHE